MMDTDADYDDKGSPNPYYKKPFSIANMANRGTAGALNYEFHANNEGTYTLSLTMMGHCGAGKDSIRVAARCFPIEAKPVFFLPSGASGHTHGTGGRGVAKAGAATRGRNIDLGFTPLTKNLIVRSSDKTGAAAVSSTVTGKGQWEDAAPLIAGFTDLAATAGHYSAYDEMYAKIYKAKGQYVVGFNANDLDNTGTADTGFITGGNPANVATNFIGGAAADSQPSSASRPSFIATMLTQLEPNRGCRTV
jgi:hypothetical protein